MKLRPWMRRLLAAEALLRISAVSALVGIGLMLWSLFHPTVVSVMVAMMIGQGLGVVSFLLYLGAMARDFRHALRNQHASPDREPADGP